MLASLIYALECSDLIQLPQQEALVVEQLHEGVGRRGLEVAREQLLCQEEERGGVLAEEVDAENGLRRRQVEALQLRIQAGARRPKVRYAGANTDARTTHADDVLRLACTRS